MNDHLLETSLALYTPASKVTVDEAIFPFQGRARETTCIPTKPTPDGFKVWVLAQKGYFSAWIFHMPGGPKPKGGLKIGPQGVVKMGGLSPTASVVPFLVQRLPNWATGKYHVFTDNLFTSLPLLTYCHEQYIGITGTCRADAGLHIDIIHLHKKDRKRNNMDCAWGHKTTRYISKGKIAQMGWKDGAYALFMSTVIDPKLDQMRLRHRPKTTSKKAATSRKAFNGLNEKMLPIPNLVNEYNHHMNGVDIGDQLRSEITWRREKKNWRALFWNLMGVAICNSYLLSNHMPGGYTSFTNFRLDLVMTLWRRPDRIQTTLGESILGKRKRASIGVHERVKMTQSLCYSCSMTDGRPRIILGEISANQKLKKRSTWGCGTCDVNLCVYGECWAKWHINKEDNK